MTGITVSHKVAAWNTNAEWGGMDDEEVGSSLAVRFSCVWGWQAQVLEGVWITTDKGA